MTSGSLSSYLGTMAPKSTRDVSFSLTPSAGFTGGVANITVNSVGTGADTNKGRYRYVHHHLGSGISAGPL